MPLSADQTCNPEMSYQLRACIVHDPESLEPGSLGSSLDRLGIRDVVDASIVQRVSKEGRAEVSTVRQALLASSVSLPFLNRW